MQTYTTNLRKVGGSVMLAVPPIYLEMLHLEPGLAVDISVREGRLMVDPKPRPRYTLDQLLANSDYSQKQTPQEREWIDAPSVGREL